MDIDTFGKLAPILAALIALIGAVFGTVFASQRIGRRHKQEHALDIATKRLAFWDLYLKTALAAASDEERKSAIELEVTAGIQCVRRDVDHQLERVSWRFAVAQKKLLAKKLSVGHAIEYYFLLTIAWLSFICGIGILILVAIIHGNRNVSIARNVETLLVVLVFMLLAAFLVDRAQMIRYMRDELIINRI